MRKPLLAALIVGLLLGGCARVRESRLNPFNWFGRSTEVVQPVVETPVAADGRPLVDQVVSMAVEPVPGGAIIRATGLPPTQGFWDGALVAENDGLPVNGVLTYRFVLVPPPDPARVSTQRSREVTVAVYLPDARLAPVAQITVAGARNALASRR